MQFQKMSLTEPYEIIMKMLLKILIILLIVLKNQKELLSTTQKPFTAGNKYPKILEVIARAIYFHGRQGPAIRGHKKTIEESD